jgi:hypothetical protein
LRGDKNLLTFKSKSLAERKAVLSQTVADGERLVPPTVVPYGIMLQFWFVRMRSIMKYGTNTDSDFWQFVAKRRYLEGGQKPANIQEYIIS